MMHTDDVATTKDRQVSPPNSVSIDWYAEGQSRSVEVDGVLIVVRFVGRKGRRSRIAISAPAGAAFRDQEPAN